MASKVNMPWRVVAESTSDRYKISSTWRQLNQDQPLKTHKPCIIALEKIWISLPQLLYKDAWNAGQTGDNMLQYLILTP